MPLPNTGMSFTPFDPLAASELNDLVENIEALAAGTGLNNASVPSTALVEGYLRLRRRDITTDSAPTGYTEQVGWAFINGDGGSTVTTTVTFPVAFSAVPVPFISYIGAKADPDPTTISQFSSGASGFYAHCGGVSTTGFTAAIIARDSGGTTAAGTNYGFSWRFIGPV